MQLSGKRALALVAALSLATAGSAFAQDTTEAGGARFDTTEAGAGAIDTATADTSAVGDTTDTSGVQNPPGYRGMERDTTIFPPQDDSAAAGRVEDKATGTYDDSAWQDTSETEVQNPPGYRGMERPVGGDSAAGQDTSAVGDTTDTSGVQNPPGYRGMERDTTIFPPEGGPPAEPGQVEDKATGTYDDSAWQDTSETEVQNPPGYRGYERPVGGDSAAEHDTTEHSGAGAGDTTAQTPDSAQ